MLQPTESVNKKARVLRPLLEALKMVHGAIANIQLRAARIQRNYLPT